MIFSIQEISTMKKILPAHCESYLKKKSWIRKSTIPYKGSIWKKIVDKEQIIVLIPLDTNLKDYINRIADFIVIIKKIENRSFELITREIFNNGVSNNKVKALLL